MTPTPPPRPPGGWPGIDPGQLGFSGRELGTAEGGHPAKKLKTRSRSKVIDKSVVALPEPRRMRDRDHVRKVAMKPCLICGRQPCDAHHLRFTQSPVLGRKVSDEFTLPLCRGHHREVHRCGDEVVGWKKVGLDPAVAARTPWLETHPMTGRSNTATNL